jgi:phage baseplate assembly protein V
VISREDLKQIMHLLRPVATRVANIVARGVVQLADDSKKLQLIQLGGLAGETVDGAEFLQAYGFSSVPLDGAEVVVVFPGGDRSHPLVIAAADRRYRPTGAQPGEVTMYNSAGAKIIMKQDGSIVASAAPGKTVSIDDGSGTAEALVKRSEFLAHGHVIVASGATSPCTGPTTSSGPGTPTSFPGTSVLEAK